MVALHAIWNRGCLHLWGERPETIASIDGSSHDDIDATARHPYAASVEELRTLVADAWDSLLATGATTETISIELPAIGGVPIASIANGVHGDATHGARLLKSFYVDVLTFTAADAVDVLSSVPAFDGETLHVGASLTYWARAAELVLERLAAQRFVPAIHEAGDNRFRGYWRVVVDDAETSQRLGVLIASMPPVCRAVEGGVQAADLIENFLWTTVDALVRRCLEGDELAHAIHEEARASSSLQTQWLCSLVRGDGWLTSETGERRQIAETVGNWIGTLGVGVDDRGFRTCFQLHAPPEAVEGLSATIDSDWELSLHLQAKNKPELILDAESLSRVERDDPRILSGPFDHARVSLAADVSHAERHFPPLGRWAELGLEQRLKLTLAEAYSFLRDAAPILKSEDFGVWTPSWWRDNRDRLRMQMNVRPRQEGEFHEGAMMPLEALVVHDWRVAVGDEELSDGEIARLASASEPLVKIRGRWTEVQSVDVQAAQEFLKQNAGGEGTLFEALRQYYSADDLDTGLPVAGLQAHGWVDRLMRASEMNAHFEMVPPPVGFKGELRDYQKKGQAWLAFLSRCGLGACLADDMGLGKTIQLIALWLHERESKESPGPTLLVVPMSLVGNWQREIERFGPELKVLVHHGLDRLTGQRFVDEASRHDIVISTYGLIPRDLDHLSAVRWHRIALDEAQNIKNPIAKQGRAIRSLRAVHRVALTGTPVENRLSELWSIMDFLNPGHLGTATDFRRRFAVPVERHHDAARAERLRHLIRPFVLRRLKSDPTIAADLPAKMEMRVFCNLTKEQAGLYQAVVDDMIGQIDQSGGIQRRGLILATLTKLKQICNHPAHFLQDGSSLPHRGGKSNRLVEMLEEVVAEGDRALVFTQYRQMGHLLEQLLQASLGREIIFLHGGSTKKQRDKMVDRFQDSGEDLPVFILSLKAGGFGLNLTAASHVFHFDRWWNPAVEDQATDRAHRIGQDKRVQVHKFVCIGTLEERVDQLLEKKRNLADRIVGSGEEWLTELSTDALRDLFSLSNDAVAED